MKNVFFCFLSAMLVLGTAEAPARAEVIDASTISCKKLADAYESKTASDLSFVNGILNWMGGYHATEAQGTVVDWDRLSKAFDQTVAFCIEHPNVGIMSASEKFMGDHIENTGPNAFDLAILTCEAILTDKNLIKNIGDTFMWLTGYHASYNNTDSTMLDLEKFIEHTGQIADYCAANTQSGLVTASEKFMSDEQ